MSKRPAESDDNPRDAKRGNTNDSTTPTTTTPTPSEPKTARIKKKPYALCFGYIGTGYQGLQWQAGDHVKTIEEDVRQAVHAAGGISADNMTAGDSGLNPLQKVAWMRASRTDKGVHAVMNILSLKLQAPDSVPQFVAACNAHLPPQIRMYDAVKVAGSFHAKNSVSHRHYSYVLPTFSFLEDFGEYFSPESAELEITNGVVQATDCFDDSDENPQKGKKVKEYEPNPQEYGNIPSELFQKLQKYRMTDKTKDAVNELLSTYLGTHFFHNYTRDKVPGEASAQRYITEFKITHIEVQHGIEVASISVKGAAFMMHQIRRMIGMAICAFNAKLGPDYILRSLGKESKVLVPTAPPTGLLLCKLIYDYYHCKLDHMRKGKSAGVDDLQNLDFEHKAEEMETMFHSIRGEIMRQELEGQVMACWIRSVPHILIKHMKIDIYEQLRECKAKETL